jgi:hypothetical protein
VRVFDALVCAGRHQAPKASLRSRAVVIDIYDALHLWMIKEEAVHGAITAIYKGLGEATNIKTLHAFFTVVPTAEKFDASIGVI